MWLTGHSGGGSFCPARVDHSPPHERLIRDEICNSYNSYADNSFFFFVIMKNPAIRKALTIEEAFWHSERERRLYELREKALRDELVMLDGARAEGKAAGITEGKAAGKAEMAQEAICKYLEARFGEASLDLQQKVRALGQLESLNQIMNKIYLAGSLDDARAIIEGLQVTTPASEEAK
jgi:hypothetical protein